MMPKKQPGPIPTQFNLHQKSRTLEINFDDGSRFQLPCEYLRVFSPSAEVRVVTNRGEAVTGKENVNITDIKPVGSYAVQLYFDDGHDTGIYPWETLYELGVNQEKNWQDYLKRLAAMGYQHKASEETSTTGGPIKVKILYFATLVDQLGTASEEVEVPGSATDVQSLIAWLRQRGANWERALGERVKVTVNKQFAAPQTKIKNNDEIALVPEPPA